MASIRKFCGMLVMGVVSLFPCCSMGDYAKDLPNGYELVRTNTHTKMIWTRRGSPRGRKCVVPPDIQEIAVRGNYVFGWLVTSPRADKFGESIPGYFLLDTSTGEVLLGLDEEDWKSKLREIGLENPLSLLRHPRWL